MKLVEQKAELIEQDFSSINGLYKHIEKAARTAYKSEDKITDDSAADFVARMIKSNHLSTLEHGTIYLKFRVNGETREFLEFFKQNKYSRVNENIYQDEHEYHNWHHDAYVTTNYRVITEARKELEELLGEDYRLINFACEPTEFHVKRYTVRTNINIGVSREGNRHRTFSITEQSTRYCNYSKDKFGNQLTFIIPQWVQELNSDEYFYWDGDWCSSENNDISDSTVLYHPKKHDPINIFLHALKDSEMHYKSLIECGWTPQQAREVLPLDTATECVYTAFEDDWKHFLDLRLYGKTGAPHPNMKKAAELIHEQLIKAGYKD